MQHNRLVFVCVMPWCGAKKCQERHFYLAYTAATVEAGSLVKYFNMYVKVGPRAAVAVVVEN